MDHVPPGWPAAIPRLSVDDPRGAVQFLRDVFDATGEFNEGRPSEMRIGDSLIMVGSTMERMPTSSFIYIYVPDADKSYDRALCAGSTSIERPEEMPYGDRRAMIKDAWGNYWLIATHRKFTT